MRSTTASCDGAGGEAEEGRDWGRWCVGDPHAVDVTVIEVAVLVAITSVFIQFPPRRLRLAPIATATNSVPIGAGMWLTQIW